MCTIHHNHRSKKFKKLKNKVDNITANPVTLYVSVSALVFNRTARKTIELTSLGRQRNLGKREEDLETRCIMDFIATYRKKWIKVYGKLMGRIPKTLKYKSTGDGLEDMERQPLKLEQRGISTWKRLSRYDNCLPLTYE